VCELGVRAGIVHSFVRQCQLLGGGRGRGRAGAGAAGLRLLFLGPYFTGEGFAEVEAHTLSGVTVLGYGFSQAR